MNKYRVRENCEKQTKQEETFKLSSKLCSKTSLGEWKKGGELALQYM